MLLQCDWATLLLITVCLLFLILAHPSTPLCTHWQNMHHGLSVMKCDKMVSVIQRENTEFKVLKPRLSLGFKMLQVCAGAVRLWDHLFLPVDKSNRKRADCCKGADSFLGNRRTACIQTLGCITNHSPFKVFLNGGLKNPCRLLLIDDELIWSIWVRFSFLENWTWILLKTLQSCNHSFNLWAHNYSFSANLAPLGKKASLFPVVEKPPSY